jgi:hypothetical protein
VPLNVAVPLLASETEDVEALGRDDLTNGFADPAHDVLQLQVFRAAEIRGDLFPVFAGRNEHVSVQRGIRIEKRDGSVVLVDDVVRELRVADDQLADEAAIAEPPSESLEVHTATGHGSKRMAPRLASRPSERRGAGPRTPRLLRPCRGTVPGRGPKGRVQAVSVRDGMCVPNVCLFFPSRRKRPGLRPPAGPTLLM